MVVRVSKAMSNWFSWIERNPDPGAKEGQVIGELRKSGRRIINLSGASIPRYKEDRDEGCMNTVATRHLIEEARREEWGTYPTSSADIGVKEDAIFNLRQAIAGFLKRYCGIGTSSEHVMIGHATSGSMAMVHMALLDPGDEIISIEPSHYPIQEYKTALMMQANLRTASSDPNNHWEPNFDELRKNINERTKAIVINQPVNPTGIIYSDKTIRQLVDIAGENNLLIISDEMYQLITYDGLKAKSVASLAGDVPTIVTGSMSKFFMKPGWCLGYAYFHDPAGKMEELERAAFLISGTAGFAATRIPTPILVAAGKTYADDQAINESFEMVRSLQAKRDFTCKRINEIKGLSIVPPQATFYGFFRVNEIGQKDSRWIDEYEFVLEVLRSEGILLRAGQRMGKSGFGHVRTLLYRNKSVLSEAYDRLEAFMQTKK